MFKGHFKLIYPASVFFYIIHEIYCTIKMINLVKYDPATDVYRYESRIYSGRKLDKNDTSFI